MKESSDLVARGEAYYRQHLKSAVEPRHIGKFMILEVESGDYEIDEREIKAYHRLRIRYPHRHFYTLRIGYPAAHAWGTRLVPNDARDDD